MKVFDFVEEDRKRKHAETLAEMNRSIQEMQTQIEALRLQLGGAVVGRYDKDSANA